MGEFLGITHKLGCSGEKVEVGCIICQDESDTHTGCAENTGHLMAHELSEQAQKEEHKEGYGKN